MRFCLLTALCCVAVLAACTAPQAALADTNANCSYSDFLGDWQLSLSQPVASSFNCSDSSAIQWSPAGTITLQFPNIVPNNVPGNWTLIYNQGVEVWVNGAILFWFAAYNDTASFCGQSQEGWMHPVTPSAPGTVDVQCASLVRLTSAALPTAELTLTEDSLASPSTEAKLTTRKHRFAGADELYETNMDFIDAVNAAQDMFTVGRYPEHEKMTVGALQRRRGSSAVRLQDMMPPHAIERKQQPRHSQKTASGPKRAIPENFDWRNISGVSYVSPVRNQGECGSCYSYGSTAMMEARIRIASNNARQPILSTQEIVSCSQYSQGCDGGFPYLVAGKYGRDFGLLEDECYPAYNGSGVTLPCTPFAEPPVGCNPQRWMTNEYYYIGGYYGESTVELMQEEILINGPIAVSFEAYDDLQQYTGGVYTHQFTRDLVDGAFDPFELTNHVVCIVGWGVTDDANAIPFWIVKNSWGAQWGENGYFRILRGSSETGGECAIESITVSAIPILH